MGTIPAQCNEFIYTFGKGGLVEYYLHWYVRHSNNLFTLKYESLYDLACDIFIAHQIAGYGVVID